ncbi:hypothetical protein AB0D11_30725 [Streptomyces monashensis]|uniref:hypothetical protein n=1 Tax=Streptomyces monashensis TaxID=1678012 RepID=UPI0033EF98E4
MKLGKALATGVAEERPLVREEEIPLPEGTATATDTATVHVEPAEPAEPAREEVPAVR